MLDWIKSRLGVVSVADAETSRLDAIRVAKDDGIKLAGVAASRAAEDAERKTIKKALRLVSGDQAPTGQREFARLAVSANHMAGGVASPAEWLINRNEFVQHYKGSVYMAVGAIARKIAMQSANVGVVRHLKSGTKIEDVSPNHPLVRLFEEVNPQMTQYDLWFSTMVWRLTTGDAFWWKARNGFGLPAELWPMPSQWVHAIPSPKKYIAGWLVKGVFGEDAIFPEKDMIHLKEFAPDWSGTGRFYGLPPMAAAATAIDLEEAMYKRLHSEFKNFAPPGLHYETDETLEQSQLEEIFAQILNMHSMAEQAGTPIISHAGLKASEFRASIREMDYQASLDATTEHILAIFGVPKAVLGLVKDANRANMEASLLTFCHDEQTECLTKDGWKTYDQLILNDKIATYDPDSDSLRYETPEKIHVLDYEGPMHYWETEHVDVAVTPEHRMYVQTVEKPHQEKRCRPWRVRRMYELAATTPYRLKQAAADRYVASGEDFEIELERSRKGMKQLVIPREVFVKMVGWYVTEGHATTNWRIGFTQSPDGPHFDDLKKTVESIGLTFHEQTHPESGCVQFTLNCKQLWEYFVENFGRKSHEKKLGRVVVNWGAEDRRLLLETLLQGDGIDWRLTNESEGIWSANYTTTSKRLADEIMQLGIGCGYRSSVVDHEKKREGRLQTYRVNLTTRNDTCVVHQRRRVEQYSGKVWCVTVPTGLFIVRRNGKAHVSGNCENTINPLLTQIGQHLTQWLAREFDPKLVVWFDDCTVNDIEQIRKNYETAHKSGATTPNEVREVLLELPPYKFGGDTPMVGANMVPAAFGNEPPPEPVIDPLTGAPMGEPGMGGPPNGQQPPPLGPEEGMDVGGDGLLDEPSTARAQRFFRRSMSLVPQSDRNGQSTWRGGLRSTSNGKSRSQEK